MTRSSIPRLNRRGLLRRCLAAALGAPALPVASAAPSLSPRPTTPRIGRSSARVATDPLTVPATLARRPEASPPPGSPGSPATQERLFTPATPAAPTGPAAVVIDEFPSEARLQTSPIRGFRYRQPAELLDSLLPGRLLHFEPEPSNPYDHYAVKVLLDGTHIGYLPREDNRHAGRLLRQGVRLTGRIVAVHPDRYHSEPIRFDILLDLSPPHRTPPTVAPIYARSR